MNVAVLRPEVDSVNDQHDLLTPAAEIPAPRNSPTTRPLSFGGPEPTDRFDWNEDNSVCISEQPATAIYTNRWDQIVIRQQARWDEEEDRIILISRANIEHFISMLQMEAKS